MLTVRMKDHESNYTGPTAFGKTNVPQLKNASPLLCVSVLTGAGGRAACPLIGTSVVRSPAPPVCIGVLWQVPV